MAQASVTPAVTITAGKGNPPVAYFEAVWHEPQPDGPAVAAKQRIGKAWLDYKGEDEDGKPQWVKRRGRVDEGFYDERRAHAAAPAAIAAWRERRAARERVPTPAEVVTVRELAHEWLGWLQYVKGASPATVRDYGCLLREPGTPAKRGAHRSAGRLMKRFGDRRAAEVQMRDVSSWLRALDQEGLTARNVNKHRQILRNIFVYGARRDTYGLVTNPVDGTDKRREEPPGRLDYFEVEDVEALAREAERGAQRQPRGRARPEHKGPAEPAMLSARQRARQEAERVRREQMDRQDGELFRVMLYSGLRVGEARALQIRDVTFLADMSGAVLDVRRAFSANELKPPKSWRPRVVPLPRPGAEALARVMQRDDFIGDEDFVFVNRVGGALDDTAIRRRYKAAREAAGLRPLKLHGLRHAAGSMIAQSAGPLAARDVLGHARISTTDRYLHGKVDGRAIAAMNAAFGVSQKTDA
jgi:site-specific recombinase XerD